MKKTVLGLCCFLASNTMHAAITSNISEIVQYLQINQEGLKFQFSNRRDCNSQLVAQTQQFLKENPDGYTKRLESFLMALGNQTQRMNGLFHEINQQFWIDIDELSVQQLETISEVIEAEGANIPEQDVAVEYRLEEPNVTSKESQLFSHKERILFGQFSAAFGANQTCIELADQNKTRIAKLLNLIVKRNKKQKITPQGFRSFLNNCYESPVKVTYEWMHDVLKNSVMSFEGLSEEQIRSIVGMIAPTQDDNTPSMQRFTIMLQ